jgi:hypothetical protein
MIKIIDSDVLLSSTHQVLPLHGFTPQTTMALALLSTPLSFYSIPAVWLTAFVPVMLKVHISNCQTVIRALKN